MSLTAEEFWQRRDDLPEGGRGCELVRGEVFAYPPAGVPHGNAVLHLSKRLAAWAQARGPSAGATCFEMGLLVARDPDTLYFPAVSHFPECGPFELSDSVWTDLTPQLVIELASDTDRRRAIAAKQLHYAKLGVREIWIIDTVEQALSVIANGGSPRVLRGTETFADSVVLSDFTIPVAALFAEPTWWNPAPRN